MTTIDEQIEQLEKLKQDRDYLAPLEAELIEHYSHVDAGELVLKPCITNIHYESDGELCFWIYIYIETKGGDYVYSVSTIYLGESITAEQAIKDLNDTLNRHLAKQRILFANLPNGLGGTE